MAQLGTLEYLIKINSSQLSSGLSSAEGKMKGFGNKLSSWAVAKGQIIANLASKAISSTIDFVTGAIDERKGFDKAMSQVAATLGKSVAEMNSEIGSTDTAFGHFEGTLTDFARYMGANTAYTATEAAEALNYMALAGYDTQKSMNMLPNVLNLAAAGNFDLARASDMVTDAQSALGLTTGETTVMVDQMAKTASKTNTSVEQLGDAMLTVGGTAKMLKGGTRELNAVLGVLADNGIKGSEGGTALRNIMLSLSAPTKKASKELKNLGIDVFDSAGNMRALPDIMADFNSATKDMTSEKRANILSKIFNKRDLKSIEALLGTTTERWDELNDAITNSEGAAGEMAETQLDNLAGDATKFESALSEAKLALVEGLTPALRNLTQRGTALVQRLTTAFKKDGFKGVVEEAKKAVVDLMHEWENSENPIKRAVGKIGTILSNGLSWDNLGEAITVAWDTVLVGFDKLGKIVFGEKADGTIDWPEWDDVSEAATKAWDGIKAGALALGGLVFGKKSDGSVDWPTWDDVQEKAHEIWSNIKLKAREVGGIVFGKKADGSIDWPTWEGKNGVKAKGEAAWNTIKAKALEISTGVGALVFGSNKDGTVNFPDGNAIATSISTWWSEATSSIGNLFDSIFHIPSSDEIVADLQGKLNNVISWINSNLGTNIQPLGTDYTKDVTEGIDSTEQQALTLIAKLEELNKMYGEGASYLPIWKQTVTDLTTLIPDLGDQFDTETGKIKSNTDELKENVKQWAELSRQKALNEAMKGQTEELAKAQYRVVDARANLKVAQDNMQAKADQIRDAYERLVNSDFFQANQGSIIDVEDKNNVQETYDAFTKMFNLISTQPNMTNADLAHILNIPEDEVNNFLEIVGGYDELQKAVTDAETEVESANTALDVAQERYQQYSAAITEMMNEATTATDGTTTAVNNLSIALSKLPSGSFVPPRAALPKAKGDWNVPYDNYLANLHRGEMVLTASQARKYREGNDLSGLADLVPMIADAVRSGMQGTSVNSYLDGNNVTSQTNRITGTILSARRFAPA